MSFAVGEQRVDLVLVGDVGVDVGQQVGPAELPDELVAALVVEVADHDAGSLLDEALHRGQPDARAAAGDDRDPVLDASCHGVVLLRGAGCGGRGCRRVFLVRVWRASGR